MEKCYNCDYCKIIIDQLGYTEAKCVAKSSKGRVIAWAHTTYSSMKGDNPRYGKDFVVDFIKRRKRPSWCSIHE